MSEELIEFFSESIYGDKYTKDNKKYIKNKINSINTGESCFYIKDKSQSLKLIDGLEFLINEYTNTRNTITILRDKLKKCPKDSDWDYISNKYQESLNDIKNIKDECKNEIKNIETNYYEKLKNDIKDTQPYIDLTEKHNKSVEEYTKLYNEYYKNQNILTELKERYESLLDDHCKEKRENSTAGHEKRLRKKIEKEFMDREDKTKKDLQKQVKNLKQLLKFEQEKNMLLIDS